MAKTKIALLYERLCRDDGLQGESFSIQNPKAMLEDYAQRNGFSRFKRFTDEGLTGARMEQRDDFNRMPADCRKGKSDRVLVKSISRFSRNARDCLATLRELTALGVAVCFEKENIDTGTLTTEPMVSVSGALAQEESVSISKNQRLSYQRQMERGEFITCFAPLGYRLVGGKNLKIVLEEAKTVRWIFQQYLNGENLAEIASELGKQGLTTATGKEIWCEKTVRKILGNKKYCGDALLFKTRTLDPISQKTVKNTGEWPMVYIEGNHEGIVPKAVFLRVQKEMARWASKRKIMQKHGRTEQGVEQAALVDQALKNMEDSELNARMKAVVEEKQDILNQLAALQKEAERQSIQASRRREMEAWLAQQPDVPTEYDDGVTRRLVERIAVVDAETIRVKLKDTDVKIEQRLC